MSILFILSKKIAELNCERISYVFCINTESAFWIGSRWTEWLASQKGLLSLIF